MEKQIDPKFYGLPPRTILMKRDLNRFTLVINRKSRIVMKDAFTIIKKAEKIKEKAPGASVSLETNAPVCSKSIKFLEENDIDVVSATKNREILYHPV